LTKFKDELRNYPWPRSSAIKEHGKRWLRHASAEEIWQKVSRAAGPNLTAHEFILFVIRARTAAGSLSARIKVSASDRASVIRWHQPKIKEALASTRSLSEIAVVLEDAAFEMQQIEKSSTIVLADYPAGAISSKDQKGSQRRRAFCLIMFEFFRERCRQWMDGPVATLVDIAFPRGEATTEDAVREFRKSRPPRNSAPLH